MSTTVPLTGWRAVQAAERAELRKNLYIFACQRARQMMPRLSAEAAAELRVGLLSGPDGNLPELVAKHRIPS